MRAVLPAAGNKVHIVVYITADINQSAVFILGKGDEPIRNIVYLARAPDRKYCIKN